MVAMFCTMPAFCAGTVTPDPSNLVSVCSGVSLPRSEITNLIDPVVTGIYSPIESNINQTLGALAPITGLLGIL